MNCITPKATSPMAKKSRPTGMSRSMVSSSACVIEPTAARASAASTAEHLAEGEVVAVEDLKAELFHPVRQPAQRVADRRSAALVLPVKSRYILYPATGRLSPLFD